MGLTNASMGAGALDEGLHICKKTPDDKVIALAGNPNVGKSTVFNQLTKLNQHTGNWPGKTVANAQGTYTFEGTDYILVDLPGTYSLLAHSQEEEIARDFICFGEADAVVVVCDATCLERNVNLVLQTLEITPHVVVCVNLMDEAEKKHIRIELQMLERRLGVPVVGAAARSNRGLAELMRRVREVAAQPRAQAGRPVEYTPPVERAAETVERTLAGRAGALSARWTALRLLDADDALAARLAPGEAAREAVAQAHAQLAEEGIGLETLRDSMVANIFERAHEVCAGAVFSAGNVHQRQLKIDRILTSKWTGIPIMLALLAVVFWLTIAGANAPSQLLADGLFWVQDRLSELFWALGAPDWLHGAVVLGIYRVLAWVVSVMLPPMAIFFPLFTLLEDLGYLPRVAFNLDRQLRRCNACGKQALTMCMGFGCNAAGVVGCRIIDSPRERLIAILTNNFVPCNGRFPTLISIISMFFVGTVVGLGQTALSAVLLVAVIVLGVLMTFLASRVLSATLLKGVPSSFALELPPFRRPQIGKVIVRSVLDRTLFVLGRAAAVAAPAGLVIWLMANVQVEGLTLLAHCAGFLDPFARLLGLDGVILVAFILGLPANEIVIPLVIMAYLSQGSISELASLAELRALLVDNGWTWLTAVCTMLFSLMHWPCTTTLLTIHRETQSWKWTGISLLVPTLAGMAVCMAVAGIARLLGAV